MKKKKREVFFKNYLSLRRVSQKKSIKVRQFDSTLRAGGDLTAVVAAYRLNPTQIRIANHITRPPDGEVITESNPEIARIRDGKVVIEKLKI